MTIQCKREEPAAYSNTPRCLICTQPLLVRIVRGRRSGKPFVMLICSQDARHFRAFINDRDYVAQVLERLEDRA